MDRSDVQWRGYYAALPTPFTESGELDVEEGAGKAQLLEGHPTGLGEADECLVESKAWVGRACPTLDRAHLARPPAEVTDFRHCP